jgi:rhodanese-related sulfurtransferase
VAVPTKNPQEPFQRITVEEAKQMMAEGAQVIDVREAPEYQDGHMPGAIHMPVAAIFPRREELAKDTPIIFVCAVGARSALACEMAAAAGISEDLLYNLEKGVEAWLKVSEPTET